MKKIIGCTVVFAICAGFVTCKPRRSDLSSGDGGSDEQKLAAIASWRAYSTQFGIHISSHPIYDEVAEIVADLEGRVDRVGYFIKLETLKFIAEELANKELPSIGSQKQPLDFEKTISKIQLSSRNAPTCETPEIASNPRKFFVCYDTDTCSAVIDTLQTFAKASYWIADERKLDLLKRKFSELNQDLECLDPSMHRELLSFRAKNLRIQSLFFENFFHQPLKRPRFATSWDGNGQQKNTQKAVAELRKELSAQIKYADDNILMADDPTRLNYRVIYNLYSDKVFRPDLSLPPDEDDAPKKDEQIEQQLEQWFAQKDHDQLQLKIPEASRQRLQIEVDQFAMKATASHTFNRAMLFYLNRLSMSDIRPWLKEIKDKVLNWRDWQRQYVVSGTVRPSSVENISPTLAFAMLSVFVEREITLPFRHEYLETMKYMVDRIVQTYQFGQDSELIKEAQLEVDGFKAGIQDFDRMVIEKANALGFQATNLIYREKDLTTKFSDFDSLMDEFSKYQDAFVKIHEAQQDLEKRIPDLAKRVNEQSKEVKDALEEYTKLQNNLMKGAIKFACIGFAAGENQNHYTANFFNTGLPDQQLGSCYKWWYNLPGFGNTEHFDESKGLKGIVALKDACGFKTNGAGDLVLPLSRQMSEQRIEKILFDEKHTRKCAEETLVLKETGISASIMLLTLPLSLGVSGAVMPVMMNRLANQAIIKGLQGQVIRWGEKQLMGQLLFKERLALYATRTLLGTTYMGISSFMTSIIFDAFGRASAAVLGRPVFDPTKGAFQQWGRAIGASTFVFMAMHPVSMLGRWASLEAVSRIPMSHLAQVRTLKWTPFVTTTAFFTESHRIVDLFNQVTGDVSEIPPESFAKRLVTAVVMAKGFEIWGKVSNRLKLTKMPINDIDALLKQAETMRMYRVGPFNDQFLANFRWSGMRQQMVPRGRGGAWFLGPEAPPVDFYGMFGISNIYADPAQFQAALEWRYKFLTLKSQRYINNPKTHRLNVLKAKEWQKILDEGYRILKDPVQKPKYDYWLFSDWMPNNHGTPGPGFSDSHPAPNAYPKPLPAQ